MSDAWQVHLGKTSVWNRAGLLICHRKGVISFGDLNPEVQFQYRLTRWERIKIAAWFILQAIWEAENE